MIQQPVALADYTQDQVDELGHGEIADRLRRYSHPLLKAAADSIDYLAAQEGLLERAQQAAEHARAELAEHKRPLDEPMGRLNRRVIELTAELDAVRLKLPNADKYDDVLLPFMALMRRELHANSRKGDRPGWLGMDANTALLEVYWHVAKLSAAVKNHDGPAIQEHSADVANMAMMVLDVCGGLVPTEGPFDCGCGVECEDRRAGCRYRDRGSAVPGGVPEARCPDCNQRMSEHINGCPLYPPLGTPGVTCPAAGGVVVVKGHAVGRSEPPDGHEERLKVQTGPFKGKPQVWFTRAEVIALLAGSAVPGGVQNTRGGEQ